MSASSGMQSSSLSVTVQAAYRYLLYEPAGRARSEREGRPAVFFFHGKGERGDDLSLVARHGPPKRIAEGGAFPFILISPQCPADEYWSETPGLPEFVAAAVERHQLDLSRIYLTGLSMGAFGVWSLAQRHPGRYAAILPVCGGGELRWAPRLRDLPAWVFHGAKDDVIPVARSVQMVEAIRTAGGNPRLTIYPEAGHDSWTETYANEEIYRWLLAQRRGA